MRERIARAVSALALAALAALAVAFARDQNRPSPQAPGAVATGGPAAAPAEPTPTAPAPLPQVPDSARGRVVFEEQGCTGCHSAAGAGNPRLPLDGVALRRSRASLRAWTTGDASLADSLAPATLRRKQEYGRMPAADLEALLTFLEGLD